jgi:hypothetical protein
VCSSYRRNKAAAAAALPAVPHHDPDDDIWAVQSPSTPPMSKLQRRNTDTPTFVFTPPTPAKKQQPSFATYNDML